MARHVSPRSIAAKHKRMRAAREAAAGREVRDRRFAADASSDEPASTWRRRSAVSKKKNAKARGPAALKPPRPRCPNAACRARGGRRANACAKCGAPFSPAHAARADKAAAGLQARVPGSAEWWRRRANGQHDPAERERCRAEAAKAMGGAGLSPAAHARLLIKASGAASLQDAWLAEPDPRAQAILRGVLRGRN